MWNLFRQSFSIKSMTDIRGKQNRTSEIQIETEMRWGISWHYLFNQQSFDNYVMVNLITCFLFVVHSLSLYMSSHHTSVLRWWCRKDKIRAKHWSDIKYVWYLDSFSFYDKMFRSMWLKSVSWFEKGKRRSNNCVKLLL